MKKMLKYIFSAFWTFSFMCGAVMSFGEGQIGNTFVCILVGISPFAIYFIIKGMDRKYRDEIKSEIDNLYVNKATVSARNSNADASFYRSENDEELATDFFIRNKSKIDDYESKLYDATGNVYSGTIEEQIENCEKAVNIWNEYRNWCYKTKGGTIHFQDMWERCHNSKNPCFSYIDDIKEHLYNLKNGIDDTCLFYEVPIEIAQKLESVIRNNPGLLQKDIYEILETDNKQELRNYISYLESEEQIIRIKKGNTYELRWNDNKQKIPQDNINEGTPRLIKCPACGKDVSRQAASCPNCGHPIKTVDSTETANFCTACGKRLLSGAVYCTNCGKPVNSKEAEEEAKQIARYSQIEEYGKNTTKKKDGCNVGCLIFIILFAVAIIAAVALPNNKQTSGTRNNSAHQSETEYNYKGMVERSIKELYPDAKFDFVANYRKWEDGTFTMVENQFKINDVKHKYVARCGGGKLFHLTIDDEVIYYDEDGQWDFMTSE